MASGRNGMTRIQSVNDIRIFSTHPPRYPAMSPISVPITIVMNVPMSPTSSEMRAP